MRTSRLSLAALLCVFACSLPPGLEGGKDNSKSSKPAPASSAFSGKRAGEEREVGGVKFCWCPPGTFTMGSPRGEPERRPGEDQVKVTLSKGFWMAKFEATQGQWKRVMGKLPGELTAELPGGDDYPVGNVNFAEVEAYCRKLTELGRRSGDLPKDWEIRIPTEAQWEYACRAGTTTATSFGDKIGSKQANIKNKPYNGGDEGPSLGKASKVGSYPANAWGIHDMHGNIVEWCRDWFHAKLPGGVDPDLYSAMETATKNRTGDFSRSRRGSCWVDDGWPCRSAFRQRFEPHRRYDHIGFRVVAVQLAARVYENKLTPITDPKPLLADHPEWIEPVREKGRFEAPVLVDDEGADLHVRAWRFSYNARGIVEMPNHLLAAKTVVIMVHPWGIDDGQGWVTPEPAGVCDFCTPEKNHLAARHTRGVINPFLESLRGKVAFVMYSLPGGEDAIRKKLYRSFTYRPTEAERKQGAKELKEKLASFTYRGEALPARLTLSPTHPVRDYFQQFPGLDAGPRYNNAGFWDLPIPVTRDIDAHADDVVIYDAAGYALLRDFLKKHDVRHVLLTGYAADMCYARTTAGYENLSRDFNVFLVGDTTLATFPANATPRFATNAAVSFAALRQLVTQVSWVKYAKAERRTP